MKEYRCVLREYVTYEVTVTAEDEAEAESKAVALYEEGALYKDLYDYDLAVDIEELSNKAKATVRA